MKVYIAIPWIAYEGNGEPIGVYSSPIVANAAAASHMEAHPRACDGVEIYEYEVEA